MGKVVAVEADVERANRNLRGLEAGDGRRDAPSQRHAAALDAHQDEVLGTVRFFDYFVGDADDGATHVVRGHERMAVHRKTSRRMREA